MSLSHELAVQFAKITKDEETKKSDTIVYGTAVVYEGATYVQLDGSDILTPVSTTAVVNDGERVSVLIKNHTASITGNSSSPAARAEDVAASNEEIKNLKADNITINNSLSAANANIKNLQAADVTIQKNLSAAEADIKDLKSKTVTTETLNASYAKIDFSNIGKAAMEYFYSKSGLIKDVTVGDATIAGELVGVTISGDLIEGNTVKAEKLVIKGTDGLYYKLNTDGMTTEAEQTDQNSLNGSVIKAKSITASKISVKDLVAFDATIGGFKITENSIYSGVKESVDNTTNGLYLDKDGQIAIGDGTNFIKYYKDAEGNYKLEISAESMTVSTDVTTLKKEVAALKKEIPTVLRIESSRGTVFKNNQVSTVLSAVIYKGSKRITDISTLKTEYGETAYLEWSWQRLNEESFGTILSTDSRIGNDGFTFTLSPNDVDTKVTFMCQLITD